MLTVYPNYYPTFRCIAGACKHSCCIGWEIDIDEETLTKYKNMSGPLGDRLRRNISSFDQADQQIAAILHHLPDGRTHGAQLRCKP